MALDNWVMSRPKEDRIFLAETISEIQDVFRDLDQKKYLRTTLKSEERKDFPEILRTSNGLFDAFNMFFGIPVYQGKFIRKRNQQFVEHNKEYGFSETRYLFLHLSEAMSVFLRNVELFRCCLLFVLETKSSKEAKKVNYPFYNTMTVGKMLIQLESVCGSKGKKIKDKIAWELRNALTHGLVWQKGFDIHYSKDITFSKVDKIRLDTLWKKAREQSNVTQCLIETIADWYELTP